MCAPLPRWLAAVLGVLLAAMAFADVPPYTDPVAALRVALLRPAADELARTAVLTPAADLIHTPGDLGRALLLDEWRDDDRKYPLQQADKEVRDKVLARFDEAMRQALADPDAAVRQAAATLIGETAVRARVGGGAFDAAAVVGRAQVRYQLSALAPPLIKCMDDRDAAVRTAAVRALGKIQPDPQRAVAAMARMFRDPDADLRAAAAEALETLLATVAWDRKQPHHHGEEQAAADKEAIAVAAWTAPLAADHMDDDDARVRKACLGMARATADFLADLTPEKPPADADEDHVAAFHRRFDRELELLKGIHDPLDKLFAQVESRLHDERESTLRAEECEVLRSAATVRRRLRDGGWTQRTDSNLRNNHDPLSSLFYTRDELWDALGDHDSAVRLSAVQALEELGAEAQDTDEKLAALLLREPDVRIRREVVRAFTQLGTNTTSLAPVDALVRVLEDPDDEVRQGAAAALVPHADERPTEIVKGLAAAVKRDGGPRLAALHALAAIGPNARDASPQVIGVMDAADAAVRAAAATALGRFGKPGKPARAALRKALDDPDDAVRVAAAEALLAGK